jgi:hypothetical protein
MLASLAFAAAVAVTSATPKIDGPSLRRLMDDTRTVPAPASVVGQNFRVAIPFINGAKRDMATYRSPARWTYDYRLKELTIIIGPGEISPQNYDQFDRQGLAALPPLQSFVFDGSEAKTQITYRQVAPGSASYREEDGVRSVSHAYGLAAPYDPRADNGLPKGFRPLMVHKMRLDLRDLRATVSHMSLVLEGELTDLGQTPKVFCGDYGGGLRAMDKTGDTLTAIVAHQCFATARFSRIAVLGPRGEMAAWAQ